MNRPKSVRIGCFTYSIEFTKTKIMSLNGETSLDNKQIVIFDSGNEEAVRETLLHEILHAIHEDIFETIHSIDDYNKREEQAIRLVSPRLLLFGMQNPKVVDYIWKRK